jgi:hypothetical protein
MLPYENHHQTTLQMSPSHPLRERPVDRVVRETRLHAAHQTGQGDIVTRTQYLQELWDTSKPSYFGSGALEYRPFKGWFIVYDEPAYLGDDGNYIGWWWREAEETIRVLCKVESKPLFAGVGV